MVIERKGCVLDTFEEFEQLVKRLMYEKGVTGLSVEVEFTGNPSMPNVRVLEAQLRYV